MKAKNTFSEKTLEFLAVNYFQNSKEWFNEHKGDYTEFVLEPLTELVTLLAPTMLEIDSHLVVDPKRNGTTSRIYRDTRFSKDKSIYRDHMWCGFSRDKKIYDQLIGFFFEFSPSGFRYGCGYYNASAASMETMRRLILGNDRHFKDALQAFESQSVFKIEGDLYKKSKHPEAEEKIRHWVDRKNLDFIHTGDDFRFLFSEDLANKLAHDFKLLAPIYDFIMHVERSKNV